MTTTCKTCDKSIRTQPSRVKTGRGKFCTSACYRRGTFAQHSKLTIQDAVDIRDSYIPYKVSLHKLADRYGVHWDTIWKIVTYRSWI